MAALLVLSALIGSALAQDLLPPVFEGGKRLLPNNAFPLQTFPAQVRAAPAPHFVQPAQFGAQPVPLQAVPALSAPVFRAQSAFIQPAVVHPAFRQPVAVQPAFRQTFAAPQTFAAQPVAPLQRFQSDFVSSDPASFQQLQSGIPHGQSSFRFQDDFIPQTAVLPPGTAVVTNRLHQQDDQGSYTSQFETSDGQSVSESGKAHPTPDGKDVVFTKTGHFIFRDPQNQLFRTSWIADEGGFRAVGDHIPV